MRKVPVLALALLTALAGRAGALELKNVRAANGLLGATRPDAKFLPGDILIVAFDVEGLKVRDKTGVAVFQQKMRVTDDQDKLVFGETPKEVEEPLFGADRLPRFVPVVITLNQKPGHYKIQVTFTDKLANASKDLRYEFDILKPGFGIVQPLTPAVGFIGQDFAVNFAVVGMKRDDKTKMPDVKVSMQLLDAKGEPVVATPITNNLRDLHVEQAFDITKMQVIPIGLPVVLNRKGTFTIEIHAEDRLGKRATALRLPLTVLDPAPYINKPTKSSAE
jgi:hypothetical protein